jgi:hypothetical protein
MSLTASGRRTKMKVDAMVRGMRPAGRVLAAMVAVALIVLSSATCLLAAQMTPAQKACCVAMNHDCGAMAIEKGCCATETPNLTSLASATLTSQFASPDVVMASVSVADLIPAILFRASAAFDSDTPRYSSRSTYLLVSVFRI